MNKIAILFAILAVASAAVQTNTPSSAFAIAPGKVFTNVTDAAFTALVGDCTFNGGFDNTTNYVWCQTVTATATVPYTFQRRAINASSPGTVNSTLDTKLATTHMQAQKGAITCSGPGYFGFASDAVASGVYNLYFSYAAVNASSFTKVALTANTASGLYADPQKCMFDNGIFYIVYFAYVDANNTLNSVYVQAVNVTSGAVYYNSTGGVKLFDYTAQDLTSYITIRDLVGNNKTGSATSGLLLYTNSYSATPDTVLSSYNVLPFTLSSGAAGSLQTLATGAKTTLSGTTAVSYSSTSTITTSASTALTTFTTTIYAPVTSALAVSTLTVADGSTSFVTTDTTILNDGTTSYTTSYGVITLAPSGSSTEYVFSTTTSTSTNTAATTVLTLFSTGSSLSSTSMSGTLTSTIITTYMISAFGSLSTYGVVLVQDVATNSAMMSRDVAHVYTNSFFYNGSTTASTATNYSNPSGYYLAGVHGFSTSDGYALVEGLGSTTGGSNAYYLDQYFYNGTNKVTATSLGTFGSGLDIFPDATGSICVGYTTDDTINGVNTLAAGYAGQILYIAGASTLSSIFAALALMIAALFAF